MPSSISSSEFPDPGARSFVRAFAATLVVCVVGFAISTEALIRVYVVPHHNFYAYARQFRSAAADTAIFGDSQIAYGIAGMPDSINLARGGDDFKNVADKVRLFLDRTGRKPTRIVLQAGLHHFSYQYVWRVGRDDAFVERFGDTGPSFPAVLYPVHRREIFNYWKTFLKGADFTPKRRLRPDGGEDVETSLADVPETTRRQGAARLAQELAPVAPPPTTRVAAMVRDLVADLARRGIRACLVSMPVSPPLRRAMESHPGFDAARVFFAAVARESGIRYVDDSRVDLDVALFADLNHLNAKGARVVGPRVARECFNAN